MKDENTNETIVAHRFRTLSQQFREKAERAKTEAHKLECFRLADCYAHLAKKHQTATN